MPVFSIIIPTYNRVGFLNKTLESVYQQTYGEWECIIVDDGSTDNTNILLTNWTKKDRRFKYIHQENAERSAARNNGIKQAKGTYICFLDSDDQYCIDNLQNWFDFLKSKDFPKLMCFCDYKVDDGISIIEKKLLYNWDNRVEFLFANPIVPARMIIAKEAFETYQFDTRINIGEDVCLWLKIAQQYGLLYSSHFSVVYQFHEGNSVNPKSDAAIRMYNNYRTFFIENPHIKKKISKKLYRSYFSKIITNIAKYYYLNDRKFKSVFFLIKAIFISPIHEHTKYRLRLLFLTLFSKNAHLYE